MNILAIPLVAVSFSLTSLSANASGWLPDAKIGDGVDITDVAVYVSDDPSLLRISLSIENSSMQAVRFNGITIAGYGSTIAVGGENFDQAGPGLIVAYSESLDFSTSHLVATVPINVLQAQNNLDHIVVEVKVDGFAHPVIVHGID